ncbi:MAG: DcrB-related protein [Nitrososphaeraceae archaeon]
MNFFVLCAALFGGLFFMVLNTLEVDDGPVVVGQVFFDFEENSSNVNYLVYEDPSSGIRIKYPSNWNVLEQLGNISGNNILVDFYHTGINGTLGYSENANIIVSSPHNMDPDSLDKFTNSTIQVLARNLNNFTLHDSDSTIVSGLPAHKITYTIPGNQSETKQTQAWAVKGNKWIVFSYSAEPSAYFNPRTAQNIQDSLLIR